MRPSCRVFSASQLLRGRAAHLPEGPPRHSRVDKRSAAWLYRGPETNPSQSNANREASSGQGRASRGSAAFRRGGPRRPRQEDPRRVSAVRLKSKINRLRRGAAVRGSSWFVLGAGRVEEGRGRERGTQPVLGPGRGTPSPTGGAPAAGRGAAEAGWRLTGPRRVWGPGGGRRPARATGAGAEKWEQTPVPAEVPAPPLQPLPPHSRPAASSSAGCQSAVSMVTASGRSLRPRPLYGCPTERRGLRGRMRTLVPASLAWTRHALAFGEHGSPGRPRHPSSIQLLKKCLLSPRVPAVSMAP